MTSYIVLCAQGVLSLILAIVFLVFDEHLLAVLMWHAVIVAYAAIAVTDAKKRH